MRQGFDDDLKRRVERAEMLQALDGASLAPGNQETLNMLRDEEDFRDCEIHCPKSCLILCQRTASSWMRTDFAATSGPHGMTAEHLRPLLDDVRKMRLLSCLASNLAVADVPGVAVQMVRVGRLTALTKPDGGVRGIVAGDVVRRLVSKTIAQQLSAAVETATTPRQHALSLMGLLRNICGRMSLERKRCDDAVAFLSWATRSAPCHSGTIT